MSFLNPLFLLALAGISVPVLIHLFRRKKTRPVSWAAMRFLRQAAEARKKRVKLEDLLLMLLRCLALAAVVIALARPWWGAAPGASKIVKDVALVIDNSASMEIGDAFGRAVSQAAELVADSPQGSAFSLVAGRTTVLASPVTNRAEVLDALAGLELEATSFPAFDALGIAGATLDASTSGRPREIVVFTDGQSLGWKLDAPDRWELLRGAMESMRPAPGVEIRQIRPQQPVVNLSVTLSRDPGPPVIPGREVGFTLAVQNTGEIARVPGKIVFKNGDEVSESQIAYSVLPGGSGVTTFSAVFEESGFVEAWIEGGDDLSSDDRSAVAVAVFPPPRVLVVEGRPGTGLAIGKALDAISGSGGVERIPATGLARVAAFADYECVVLVEVSRLSTLVAGALRRYSLEGGHLVSIIGERTDVDFMNSWEGVLPSKLDPWDAAREREVVRGASTLVTYPLTDLEPKASFVPFIYDLIIAAIDAPLETEAGATVMELPRGRLLGGGRAGLKDGVGILVPRFSEDTRLSLQGRGRGHVWLDGKKIIDGHGGELVPLSAGSPTDIRIEFEPESPDGSYKLVWDSPSQPWGAVPRGRLHPFAVGESKRAAGEEGLFIRRDGAHLEFDPAAIPGSYLLGDGVPPFVVRQNPEETALGEPLDGELLASLLPAVGESHVMREPGQGLALGVLFLLLGEPVASWWVRKVRGGAA